MVNNIKIFAEKRLTIQHLLRYIYTYIHREKLLEIIKKVRRKNCISFIIDTPNRPKYIFYLLVQFGSIILNKLENLMFCTFLKNIQTNRITL
jgi:hypothetical protein